VSKKTIIIILFAVAFAGIIFVKEYTQNKAKTEADTIIPAHENLNLPLPKPEEDTKKLIFKASGSVTFLLTEKNEIYYYEGVFNGTLNKTDYKKVRFLIRKFNAEIDPNDLMFIIKSDQGASFKNVIDILDEMTINKILPGHYAETEITKEEIDGINIIKQTKNG
jgi:hypothetical protein